jgi:hypothetical protein
MQNANIMNLRGVRMHGSMCDVKGKLSGYEVLGDNEEAVG